MRALPRTALTAALVAALLGVPGVGAPAQARTGAASDLPALQASLEQATAQATALSDELEQLSARDGGLRVALERLEEERTRAQARLDARVREIWIARRPDPLGGMTQGLTAASLRRLVDQGAAASVRVERGLVEAVAEQSEATRALRVRAQAFRDSLRGRAEAALAAQERARVLLAQAEQQARTAEEQARLAAVRDALDTASATLTVALTPAQTRRSRRAQEREAPLVALAEAAGAGYPEGYGPSGQVLQGLASWYGPGFVGSPTASGSPYDPERLTCAHKSLPLGTLVRVSANGRAVSCLVNDRGPYVEPRILDMSRAGSRALGFDGVQSVVVEVLAPQ